jgi:hypothetical protein
MSSSKPVTLLMVFFVAFNLFAGAMLTTGVADMLGLDATVGGDDAVDSRTSNTNVETGTSSGDTLFGLRNVVGGQIADLFGVIFPGLSMLERAGMPSWITGGILGPLFSLWIPIGLLAIVRGWNV